MTTTFSEIPDGMLFGPPNKHGQRGKSLCRWLDHRSLTMTLLELEQERDRRRPERTQIRTRKEPM